MHISQLVVPAPATAKSAHTINDGMSPTSLSKRTEPFAPAIAAHGEPRHRLESRHGALAGPRATIQRDEYSELCRSQERRGRPSTAGIGGSPSDGVMAKEGGVAGIACSGYQRAYVEDWKFGDKSRHATNHVPADLAT